MYYIEKKSFVYYFHCLFDFQYHKQLEEAELVKDELTHLQKFHKLTWVPDYFVKSCQNPKCRSPFTQVKLQAQLVRLN